MFVLKVVLYGFPCAGVTGLPLSTSQRGAGTQTWVICKSYKHLAVSPALYFKAFVWGRIHSLV